MGDLEALAGISRQRVDAVVRMLADFPGHGKPSDCDALIDAVLLGFVESREIKKPCRSCGASLVDYRFNRITSGGRLFLHFASVDRNPEGEKPQALSAQHESAVPEADAQTPAKSLDPGASS